MSAKAVVDAIRLRHQFPEWFTTTEFCYGTGRRADVLAFNLFQSRGLEMIGYEVKASVIDLRKEIASPDKADPIVKRCDRFYLALSTKALADQAMDHCPPIWGVVYLAGGRLRTVKRAPKLPAPKLDRREIAALLSRACADAQKSIGDARSRFHAEVDREAQKLAAEKIRLLEMKHAEVREGFDAIEKAMGVKVRDHLANGHWQGMAPDRLAAAIEAIGKLTDRFAGNHPEFLANRLEHIAENVVNLAQGLRKLAPLLGAVEENR